MYEIMRRFVFLFIMLIICASAYCQNLKELQSKVNTLVLQGRYQLALDEIEKDWGSIDILQMIVKNYLLLHFIRAIALLRFLIMIVLILSLLNYLIRLLLGNHQNNETNIWQHWII